MLAAALYLLLSGGVGVAGDRRRTARPGGGSASCSASSALLGLRDKVSFLGARPEIYGNLLIIFLFPLSQRGSSPAQLVFVCIWWGAASSKLNHHFPFVVSVMISNTPLEPLEGAEAEALARLPGGHAALASSARSHRPLRHRARVQLPLILLVSQRRRRRHDRRRRDDPLPPPHPSTFPLAVPLEWNIFMIFGILFLFGHYGDVPLSTLDDPLLIADPRGRSASACRCSATSAPT